MATTERAPDGQREDFEPWVTLTVRLPSPAARIVTQAADRYWALHDPPPSVGAAWGLFVEALAADYLAGPDPEGWW